MATLTIRNLAPEVHDGLRRAAAENRRSMEEEVRLALAARYGRPAVKPEDVIARLQARLAGLPKGRMLGSEQLIAERRIEALLEVGAITREEMAAWKDRIDENRITLAEVEAFAASRHETLSS